MVLGNLSLREARHIDKFNFIGSDDQFYEPSYDHYRPTEELVNIVRPLLETECKTWGVRRVGVWSHVLPLNDPIAKPLPAQGWKIHVSATEKNCRDVLRDVAKHLLHRHTQFKFANDVMTMKMMTSKRWPRGGSGKFITIYPFDQTNFSQLIESLYPLLAEQQGSYILSDKRYRDSRCLYYRYGGIQQVNRLDFMGKMVPVLVSPDGEYFPDRRHPYFEPPIWAPDPFPSEDSEPDDLTLNQGRYLVEISLGFSNTGGVYRAKDTATGAKVVIKEARPHVELHDNGGDATTRLQREIRNLNLLSPQGICPKVLDTFWDWENFYLVEEHLDASDMRQIMLEHSPLLKVRPSKKDSESFYVKYKTIFTNLLSAIDQAHSIGMIIGDLSPPNILVNKESLEVRLIDLEAAFQPEKGDTDDIHTPGFRSSPKNRPKESSFNDDYYAAAAIMMYSMFPLVAMAYIRDDLFERVLPIIVEDIGWKDTPVLQVITELGAGKIGLRQAIEMLEREAKIDVPYEAKKFERRTPADNLSRLSRFIISNYRTDTKYTLFPSDPFSLATNSIGLGFGGTGVIYSLERSGTQVPDKATDRYMRELSKLDPKNMPPGMLTGLAGIGLVHLARARSSLGLSFVDMANASDLLKEHHSLYYGMAGIGMANLAAYNESGLTRYLDVAKELAHSLDTTSIEGDNGIHWSDDGQVRIGFGYGQSGVALFFLRLSNVLSDRRWRELGERALRFDMSYGFELEPGVVTFAAAPEGVSTYEHYIEQGTAGIVKVAIRYGMWDEVDRLLLDLHRKYCGFSGLLYGLAGLIDVFVDAYIYSGNQKYLDMAQRPYEGLSDLYIFGDAATAAVPGENLFRISCDYATGIAGVVCALHRLTTLALDDFCLDELDTSSVIVRRTGQERSAVFEEVV